MHFNRTHLKIHYLCNQPPAQAVIPTANLEKPMESARGVHSCSYSQGTTKSQIVFLEDFYLKKKIAIGVLYAETVAFSITMIEQVSFEEIVQGRDATVRVTKDNLLYAVDLAMVMTGKTKKDAARDLRILPDHVFASTKFIERMISTRGGYPTKLVSFTHAIELVMVLKGDIARTTRIKFAEILRGYIAGDASLVGEINANAQSTSAIAQLARVDVSGLHSENRKRQLEIEDEDLKLKKEDILLRKEELLLKKQEILAKQAELRMHDQDLITKTFHNVNLFASTMTMLNPAWKEDSRLRLQTEDWLKNSAFNANRLGITNGECVLTKSISVSQVTTEMGLKFDRGQNIKTGFLVAESYRQKYGKEPGTHAQWVDGAERQVKSYTERDRDLIESAIEIVKNNPKDQSVQKKRGPPRTMAE